MRIVIALISGLLFGLGLVVSNMINPDRVLAFLDVAGGSWDPTLAFVMGGALIPMALAWIWSRRQAYPFAGSAFPEPPRFGPDLRLVAGAAMFGAGWGLVGFCPGPALSALTLGGTPVLIFVAAMIAGMVLHLLLMLMTHRR
ncbi:YeeE/YedE family protein [Hwanghaeella grinnelliae]|uniref:YeeE/YedE family protein n=1 Tax=Hwanghaeella grinnelliae TaxID=2500179 RepID=A0A3S2VRS2_9PROT|nr:YeeE/YedE family protein [Hwanghaeella grinnelliae]RVU38163.1 YeeE/YedE family protein [Hwanghaeella grinnelliae]